MTKYRISDVAAWPRNKRAAHLITDSRDVLHINSAIQRQIERTEREHAGLDHGPSSKWGASFAVSAAQLQRCERAVRWLVRGAPTS